MRLMELSEEVGVKMHVNIKVFGNIIGRAAVAAINDRRDKLKRLGKRRKRSSKLMWNLGL